MFITTGTFGYALLDILLNSFIEISFILPFAGSAASESDELPNSFSLISLGVGALAVALAVMLTFEVLVEACVRDA